MAEQFQLAGITALIYDPRNVGLSDGEPKNDIDPMKQVSDYSDALTYLRTLPEVEPDQIFFFGQSFSGCVALCAGALDKRARMVISISPQLDYDLTAEKFPKILARALADRESQAAGNPPVYLPVVTKDGTSPAGMFRDEHSQEVIDYMAKAGKNGIFHPGNRTTLQTYYRLIMWQPCSIMKYMHQTPVMMVIPELDKLTSRERQLAVFDTFTGPKRVHVAVGKGHLDVLSGPELPSLIKIQMDFIKNVLAGYTDSYIANEHLCEKIGTSNG